MELGNAPRCSGNWALMTKVESKDSNSQPNPKSFWALVTQKNGKWKRQVRRTKKKKEVCDLILRLESLNTNIIQESVRKVQMSGRTKGKDLSEDLWIGITLIEVKWEFTFSYRLLSQGCGTSPLFLWWCFLKIPLDLCTSQWQVYEKTKDVILSSAIVLDIFGLWSATWLVINYRTKEMLGFEKVFKETLHEISSVDIERGDFNFSLIERVANKSNNAALGN